MDCRRRTRRFCRAIEPIHILRELPVTFSGDTAALKSCLRALFLASTALASLTIAVAPAKAQSIWGGLGSTTTTLSYNTSTNWSNPPGVAPIAPATSAVFANTGQNQVNVGTAITPDLWTFAPNAQSYAVSGAGVTFNTSAGLVDNANAGQSIRIANALNGSGAQLQLNGASTLTLTGANGYTGATTIMSGTLALSGAGSIVSSSDVQLATGAAFDISGVTTITTLVTPSTTIKSLDNTAAGQTGTVSLGGKTLIITNGGTFGGILQEGGILGGIGGQLLLTGGTLTLTGANTYHSGTIINGGTLALAGAGTIGGINNFVDVNGGTLNIGTTLQTQLEVDLISGTIIGAAAGSLSTSGTFFLQSGTVSAVLAGTGALSKTTNGTVTLSGTNTYTGLTTIAEGTLALSGTGSIAQSSGVVDNGSFDISATTAGASITTLSGSGIVTTSAGLGEGFAALSLSNASGTFSGVIGGTGGLTLNGGAETLSGANTYTGPTSVNSGASLILSGSGSVASSVAVDMIDSTFDISTTTSGATIKSLSGTGTVMLGSETLTVTNAVPSLREFTGFLGTIEGTGGLTVTGGIQVLNGTDTYSGATTVTAGGSLWISGSITQSASLSNAGTFEVLGNSSATFTGAGTNSGTIFLSNTTLPAGESSNGGLLTLMSGLTNSGTINSTGGAINGAITNTATGTITNKGTITGVLNNSGVVTNTATYNADVASNTGTIVNAGIWNTLSAGFVNSGTLTTTGTLNVTAGGLTNTGTVTANGGAVNGAVTNNATFTIAGTVTGNSTFNNALAGAKLNVNSGSYTIAGLLTNSGTLSVATGTALKASGITNNASGIITNNGTITDALNNAGLVINNAGATYNADVASNTGTIVNAGTWNTLAAGFFNSAGGTLTTSGTLNVTAGGLSNSGLVNASGTITGAVANNAAGAFTLAGNVAGVTTFTNAGLVNTSVALPINVTLGAAAFTNAAGGVITLQNGAIGDSLTLTGTYAGTAGSTIALDVNNTTAGTMGGDKIVIKGAPTSGTSSVSLAETGVLADKTFFSTPIVLINGTPGATFNLATDAATQAVTATIGLISYSLAQTAPGQWSLVSSLNAPAAGPAAATQIAALISGLNTSFFQSPGALLSSGPSDWSAFISGPSNPTPNEISGGPWIRFANGDDTITSQSTSAMTASQQASKIDSNFAGYQAGIDGGIFNINNTGMNVHFGVTAGQVFATSTDKDASAAGAVSKGSSEIPFVGLYGAVTGHNFFADVMWRTDFFHLSLTDITAPSLGGVTLLNGASEKATASTITGDIGYHFAIGQTWFIEPSAAINVSRANVHDIAFMNNGGLVSFNDIDSNLGRVGLRVGTNFVTGNLALQPFVTASLWDEFAGPTVATYQLGSASTVIRTSRIGAFEQFGLGVSGQLIGSNLLGYIRTDLRTGANIHGWDLTGGLRYQFQ